MSDAENQPGDSGTQTPPYIAFQTLKTLCGALKERGVPGRIDRSVLGNFSGGVGGQVLTALKFLKLTDGDGRPANALRDLVAAYGTDKWSSTLAPIVRAAYVPIFELDLQFATSSQFAERFRSTFPAKDNTLRKCQGFFINAVRESAIPVSAYLMKNKKPRSGPTKRRPRSNGQKHSDEVAASSASPASGTTGDSPPANDDTSRNSHRHSSKYHPFIEGLLATLPKEGEKWDGKDRAKWLTLAANAFDLIYKGEGNVKISATVSQDRDTVA